MKPLLFFILISYNTFSYSQITFPQNYFSSPLDIRLIVSGTFGELRRDHFHSGVDFATQSKINANVYCIADGYVSRIKVSPAGYGKVIYVTHPNGFVSVYAHLNEFNVVVEDYVRLKQYEKKSYDIELFPNPELFKFHKGEIIGYSGNTGSSSGPHLHFEIRNEKTERPINPFLFGYKIPDNLSPEINAVYFYPKSANSEINNSTNRTVLNVIKKGSGQYLKSNDTATVSGGIAFGILASDPQINVGSSGIYSMEISIDNHLFYKISFDSVDFDESRYINTLIDYPEYVANKKEIMQTYMSYGNRLNIYKVSENRGIYYFNDTLLHIIKFTVSDFSNNATSLEIPVKSIIQTNKKNSTPESNLPLFRFGLKNHFENKNIILDLPSDALYDSIYFEYSSEPDTKGLFSAIHKVHNKYTPLHTPAILKIKPDCLIKELLLSKLTLAYISDQSLSFVKSTWDNGFLSAGINKFGDYAIVADTNAPIIKAIRNYNNTQIYSGEIISFKINDDFSGIETYNLTINGCWVLAEYDAKNELLSYKVDKSHFIKGPNSLELVVTDKLNNKNVYSATLLN